MSCELSNEHPSSDVHYRLGNDGTKFYILTDKDAPNRKIATVDISEKQLQWKDLIPEDKNAKLEHVQMVKDYFAIVYKRNVRHL